VLTTDKDAPWLKEHLRSWRDAGIITQEQADRIGYFEHVGEPAPPQRLSLFTEVAAYVGSVLALMGGAAVVGTTWDDLAFGARLAVGLAVMAVGFGTGTWLTRYDEPGMQRLGRFLWAVGTGGVAISAFAILTQIDPDDDGVIAVGVGAAVLVVSAALWRNADRPLQMLTTAIGFGITFGGLSALMPDTPVWVGSIVLMGVGFVLAAGAALHRIQPRMPVIAVGSLGAYVGALMLSETSERLGSAVALVVAIIVVAFALRERMVPILVLGVGGSLIATQGLLATTFTGAGSALIVTGIGLLIVVIAIARGVRGHGESEEGSRHRSGG
jgi:hypothetical protein